MTSNATFYFFLIYIIILCTIEGSHFRGGSITYKILNSSESMVTISLTQTYFYNYSQVRCNDALIAKKSRTLFNKSKSIEHFATLDCVQYCNQSAGYKLIPVDSFCTDYSPVLNITVGQRSDIITLENGSYFLVANKGNTWQRLHSPKGSLVSRNWSVPCLINLEMRSDGQYNHPPIAKIISPVYIPVGILTPILIITNDANADQVRCRFAQGPDECGGVCYPEFLPNRTKLESDNCILLITGAKAGDWYAATIMVEDFIDSESISPLSSVSVQFLINVQNETDCVPPYLMGFVNDLDECVGVLVGQPYNIELIVEVDSSCSNSTTIEDIATLSFSNVIKSSIVQNSTSIWSVLLTWIPTMEQVGTEVLCAVAIDSNNVQSNPYCIQFTIAEGNISPCSEEMIISSSSTIDITVDDLLTSPDDNTAIASTMSWQRISTTTTSKPVVKTNVSTTTPFWKSRSSLATDSIESSLEPDEMLNISIFIDPELISSTPSEETNLIVPSSRSGSISPWIWAAPLIAIVGGCFLACCIWCCCCPPLAWCFKLCQKRKPPENTTQQENIVSSPNRPYRVYNIDENEPKSNIENVHKPHPKIRTTKIIAIPSSKSVKRDTPTAMADSYIFDGQRILKNNK